MPVPVVQSLRSVPFGGSKFKVQWFNEKTNDCSTSRGRSLGKIFVSVMDLPAL